MKYYNASPKKVEKFLGRGWTKCKEQTGPKDLVMLEKKEVKVEVKKAPVVDEAKQKLVAEAKELNIKSVSMSWGIPKLEEAIAKAKEDAEKEKEGDK